MHYILTTLIFFYTLCFVILYGDLSQKDYFCSVIRLGQTHISCSGLQEVAVMYNAVRKVTVTALTDIDLLVLGRDDYTDIFMQAEKDKEPRHVGFLRSVKTLDGFPFHLLPRNDPDTCMTTYFRSVSQHTPRTRYPVSLLPVGVVPYVLYIIIIIIIQFICLAHESIVLL